MSDYRIGIITMPLFKAGITPLSNLIAIMCSLSENIILITGDEGYTYFKNDRRVKTLNVPHTTHSFIVKRVFNYLSFQVNMSLAILKTRKDIDIFFFYMGGETLLMPILTARLLRKKVLLIFASSSLKVQASQKDPLVHISKITQHVSCTFADGLIVYTKRIIRDYSLERWNEKIIIAHDFFIDSGRFGVKKEYLQRECIVGYLGRLSVEKGVQNLVAALPDIVRAHNGVRILIGGEGQLRKSIETVLQKEELTGHVDLPGWVSNENYPLYLNSLKLLVLPSFTEGLPYTMLEAMACGTPVLATPVGAIPDVIIDGKTGFMMKDNTPECIAENIIRVLNTPDLAKISENGRRFVEEKYTFTKTAGIWKKGLGDMQV